MPALLSSCLNRLMAHLHSGGKVATACRIDSRMSCEAADRPLRIALALSVVIHALILSIQFDIAQRVSRAVSKHALDVILVNTRSETSRPDEKTRAQHDLIGGGESEKKTRSRSPLPMRDEDGNALVRAQQKLNQLEYKVNILVRKLKERRATLEDNQRRRRQEQITRPYIAGLDDLSSTLASIREQAQIHEVISKLDQKPRRLILGPSARADIAAPYVEHWRRRTESCGNLNYPPKARGKLYGDLIVSVVIGSDGTVLKESVERSSGIDVLDQAAVRIVNICGPYEKFPRQVSAKWDEIEVIRRWIFSPDDALATEDAPEMNPGNN